jgi:hypothetical protein
MLNVAIFVLCVLGIGGGFLGLVYLKRRQGNRPITPETWVDRSAARLVIPVGVALPDQSRAFAPNVYEVQVSTEACPVRFAPNLGRWNPTRLFYPEWYTPLESIERVVRSNAEFMTSPFAAKPHEGVEITYLGRLPENRRIALWSDDSSALATALMDLRGSQSD